MPMYEYVCLDCEKTTETIRPMADADSPIVCSHCKSKKTQREHSVFTASAAGSASPQLPMGGCGRCGDPRGSCGM